MLNNIEKLNDLLVSMELKPFDIALKHVKNINRVEFNYDDWEKLCSVKIAVQYELYGTAFVWTLDLTKYFTFENGEEYARWELDNNDEFSAFKRTITTIEGKDRKESKVEIGAIMCIQS